MMQVYTQYEMRNVVYSTITIENSENKGPIKCILTAYNVKTHETAKKVVFFGNYSEHRI